MTNQDWSELLEFLPKSRRRVLLVFPRYSPSFGTFNHAFPLVGHVKAFMPPQGILLIAALLPKAWEIQFVDENIRNARDEEFARADIIFISGMHIQRERILDINRRAHRAGAITVLGGPSVSAAPEYYPEVDLLHLGEVGDGTLELLRYLDRTIKRPAGQIAFQTGKRLPMTEFPPPAYHFLDMRQYLIGSVQFSSGCPFTCEFCDIPGLYGRNPRMKAPRQIVQELDQLVARGADSIYFVDDNFIANPRATLELLPHLVEWQRKHDHSVGLSCEATLNISTHAKVLELMRQASFNTMFCGIETPEPVALQAMGKRQNLRTPILEAIETINRHGIEVASGIILGLDTDTEETSQAIVDFARETQIPILTVNILYALPHTPLHDRLQKEGRIVFEQNRDSNIEFRVPYRTVVERWQYVISQIYKPANLFERYRTQAVRVYSRRERPKRPWKRLTMENMRRMFGILGRIVWKVGILSDYRKEFWKLVWNQKGDVETIISVSIVAHHLISYARECVSGRMLSSNYSARTLESPKNAPRTFSQTEKRELVGRG